MMSHRRVISCLEAETWACSSATRVALCGKRGQEKGGGGGRHAERDRSGVSRWGSAQVCKILSRKDREYNERLFRHEGE